MCCGNPSPPQAAAAAAKQSSPVITGYLVELPGGRTATYLTKSEAETARSNFGVSKPVREVYAAR